MSFAARQAASLGYRSARFHLYLSGIFERSRSCASPDIVSADGKNNPKLRQFGEQFNKHPNNRAPIGTGPYKFDRWDTGKEILLARNDQYWGKKGYLDKIVYRIISDGKIGPTTKRLSDLYAKRTATQGVQVVEA